MSRLEVNVNALFFPPPYNTDKEQQFALRSDGDTASTKSEANAATSIMNIVTVYNNSIDNQDIVLQVQTTHPISFRITPRQIVVPPGHAGDIRVRLVDPNPQALMAGENSTSSSVSSLRESSDGSEVGSVMSHKKIRIPKVMFEWWFVNAESQRQQIILPAYFSQPTYTSKHFNVIRYGEEIKNLPEEWPPARPEPPVVRTPSVTVPAPAASNGHVDAQPTLTTANPSICAALEVKLSNLTEQVSKKRQTLAQLKDSLKAAEEDVAAADEAAANKATPQPSLSLAPSESVNVELEDLERYRLEVQEMTTNLDYLREQLKKVANESTTQMKALDAAQARWYNAQTTLAKLQSESQVRVEQLENQIAVLNGQNARDASSGCSAVGCAVM
eukprot:PhM_4_TR770/c0_g1_i1/m.16219